MFRGLTATFTREMPGYFFFFLAYEATRGLLAGPGQSKEDIGPLRTVVAGGVAGVTLWTIIFPADVIKSRLQAGQNIVQNNFKMCKKVGCWVLEKKLSSICLHWQILSAPVLFGLAFIGLKLELDLVLWNYLTCTKYGVAPR